MLLPDTTQALVAATQIAAKILSDPGCSDELKAEIKGLVNYLDLAGTELTNMNIRSSVRRW